MKFQTASAWLLLASSGVVHAQPSDVQRGHDSILAMKGEYNVDFAFDETVLLKPDYERAPASRSAGSEVVIVLEDTPTRVVLQHLLVSPKNGHVTKHWRQDWVYEAPTRFEYSADQTWQVRAIPAAVTTGAWTQCVYEVSDAPRYCGTGKWDHRNGVSTWTSDTTWRPLPRRELTRRSDYNGLVGINQHTITPKGWSHEQFNTKVVRGADGSQTPVAREFGFNDYVRTTEVDFKPAYDYWTATAGYWAKVRQRWEGFLTKAPGARMKTKPDGMQFIIPLFTQAQDIQDGKNVTDAQIDAVFKQWVEKAPVTAK